MLADEYLFPLIDYDNRRIILITLEKSENLTKHCSSYKIIQKCLENIEIYSIFTSPLSGPLVVLDAIFDEFFMSLFEFFIVVKSAVIDEVDTDEGVLVSIQSSSTFVPLFLPKIDLTNLT